MAFSLASSADRNLGSGERVASLAAGAALLFYGLARRPSPLSALLAVAGGWLLQRGASGDCLVYRALGLGGRQGGNHRADRDWEDHVHRTVEDSFPASDPPSWTASTAGGPAG
jgi:uncharacterized membrane protein